MRTEQVEIYSNAPNSVVLRYPGRKFPGVLVQGDTLSTWCSSLEAACESSRGKVDEDTLEELVGLRDRVSAVLDHYKQVLTQHGVTVPFDA